MSAITIEEREMMVNLAKEFIRRIKVLNDELKEECYEYTIFPDNVPVFKYKAVNIQFKAFLNGRNTLSIAYNSLERTVEIQRKEIEELKTKLQAEKDNSDKNDDNSLMIVMSNIYDKVRDEYNSTSAKLRSNGRSVSASFEEYMVRELHGISKAVKIYKEKTNAK